MEALIAPAHLAVLVRALQCLCRVAGSIVVELTESGCLYWRALNDSQTAFAVLRLSPSFFLGPGSAFAPCRCRFLSRTLIWSLRPRLLASKANVKLSLSVDGLAFELRNGAGLGQRIRIGSEDIQGSVYSHSCDKRSASSSIVLNSKWCQRQMEAFHPLLKEISIQAMAETLIMRSFTEDDHDDDPACLDTEVRLRADDFERYDVDDDANSYMTFSVRELKSMLRLCEMAETNLHLFFTGAGRPLIMSSSDINDADHPWTLNVVVATFNAEDENVCSHSPSQASADLTILRHADGRPASKRPNHAEGDTHPNFPDRSLSPEL